MCPSWMAAAAAATQPSFSACWITAGTLRQPSSREAAAALCRRHPLAAVQRRRPPTPLARPGLLQIMQHALITAIRGVDVPRGCPSLEAPGPSVVGGCLRGFAAPRPAGPRCWRSPDRLQACPAAPARRPAHSCTLAPCRPTRPSSALTGRRRGRGSAGHCGRGRARRGRLMGGRFRLFKRAFELDAAANGAQAY